MNSKQIEAILEVSRTKNFTKASENLFITQPALTYLIKSLEEEIGFKIFDRSQKGAKLTIAGSYFTKRLNQMNTMMSNTIEQAKNLNNLYDDSLSLCLPTRSSLYFLPEIMKEFKSKYSNIQTNIQYIYGDARIDSLLNGSTDLLFMVEDTTRKYHNMESEIIFNSGIYLVCTKEDTLSSKEKVYIEDLDGYTLLVGGGSPYQLRLAQQKVIQRNKVNVLNSPNHESSLTFISLHEAINLIPGFLNDHNDEFSWIPFDTNEIIPCALSKRKGDNREFVNDFIQITKEIYRMHKDYPL